MGWEEFHSDFEDSMGRQRKETSYYPVFSFQAEGEKIIKTSNVAMDYETYQQYEIGDLMTVRWSERDNYLSWSGSISGIINSVDCLVCRDSVYDHWHHIFPAPVIRA